MQLAHNLLEGSIPPDVERSQNLNFLNIRENHLSGVLPSTIGQLAKLQTIILHSNKLHGKIPSSICNMTSLVFLHMSNNSLGGPLPHCLGNLSKSLQVLHLKDNHLHGLIPITFLEGCSLNSLNLNSNHFGGRLPRSLELCQTLQVLDVGNNGVRDVFPSWMDALPELRVLLLRSNRLHGTISPSPNTNASFPKLQVFDIAQNAFTGSLPEGYLSNFGGMINATEDMTNKDWFARYEESMNIILKGKELSIERILTTFTTIDMSENNFSGRIPDSIGKLDSLRYLNLSHNHLTGCIPSSLGNMTTLESLDLSTNQLNGEIPRELTSLTFLAKLNLSMNNLVGRIPQSNQFHTFGNDSYVGNQGLCGTPLSKVCEGDNELSLPPQEEDEDDVSDIFMDGFRWQIVAVGYGVGFIFGGAMGYLAVRYRKLQCLVRFFT